ncbi:hypothetical protein niasHT_006376 [Heterodera trifolii]|uniref:CCHC-type domain-containing protein n=1 Tax=Heterodera trifolii TaxID=157864 RepID=A0ABD2LPX2_9BILA
MSELLRITIAPIVKRLKLYIETAQENLTKDLTEQIKTDLLAERQNLCRAVSLLEKNNDKWEAVFHRVKGPALQEEEQNYKDYKPEGKAFMEWADQARGLVDTIDGALGLSEQGDVVHPAQVQQPAQNIPPQVVVAPQRHEVMLPPISLPKFSGEPREWPLFWKLFETSVESLQIEDFKKHIYLLGCLPEKSVARRAIDLYPPSDENYPRVVEILKKRFGDEKSIVETLQSELLHLPKPSDSVQSLRQFSESIERICQQLSDFGENEQNKFMASTIKSKLPYHLLTQVVEKELRSGGIFDCSDLRKAITSIVEVKEEGHWRPNNGNDSVGMTSPQVDRSFLALKKPQFSQRETGTRQTCSLCGAVGHPSSRCPKYSTPEARRRRLAKQRKCFNCFLKGHKAENCKSPKRCLKCGGKHHYMICRYGDAPKGSTRRTTNKTTTVQRRQSSKRRGEFPRSNKTNYSKIHVSSGVGDKPSESLAFDGNSTNRLTKVAKKSHALSTMCRAVVKKRDHQKMIENPVVFDQACQTSSKSDFYISEQKSPKLSSTESEFCGVKGGTETSAYPTNQCNECKLICSNKGVLAKIPKEIRKVELCCSENCYIHENVHKLIHEFPKEILQVITWSLIRKDYGTTSTVLLMLYLAGGESFGCGVESRSILLPVLKKFFEQESSRTHINDSSKIFDSESDHVIYVMDNRIKGWEISHPTTFFKSDIREMPIPFREGPFFSARRVNIPENAEIINDRFFEFGDPERDHEERIPLRREPRVHRQTEPLSSWIERSHGSHWYETIRDRRIVDEDLRRELRRGATLIGEHFGRAVDIHFDGLTCYGPEGLYLSPGLTVLDHFVRLGLQVDPLTPCIQEYVGFSPHEGGMLVDLYPIELVSIRHRVGVRWRAPEEDELHPPARYRAQSPDGHLENRPQRVVRRRPVNRW